MPTEDTVWSRHGGGEALATQESSGKDAMVVNVRQTKKIDLAGVLISPVNWTEKQ